MVRNVLSTLDCGILNYNIALELISFFIYERYTYVYGGE